MKWFLFGSGVSLLLKILLVVLLIAALRRGWLGRFDGRARRALRRVPGLRKHATA